MKKIFLILFAALLSISIYSCRESTQEKTKDAAKAIGKDIKTNAKKAGDKMEKGAKDLKKEIDKQAHDTDEVDEEPTEDLN